MPRLKFAGTFDDDYLKHRSPLPPEDASHAVNNGAHPDLQVDGYLRGDEEVELENLSPKGNLRFQLPGIQPRIAITRMAKTDENGVIPPPIVEAPVSPSLDTLVLLPDDGVFFLVYRAVVRDPES